MGQRIVLVGDASLLCSALELAADTYERYAEELGDRSPRLREAWVQQAAEARDLLVHAYAARDG